MMRHHKCTHLTSPITEMLLVIGQVKSDSLTANETEQVSDNN